MQLVKDYQVYIVIFYQLHTLVRYSRQLKILWFGVNFTAINSKIMYVLLNQMLYLLAKDMIALNV